MFGKRDDSRGNIKRVDTIVGKDSSFSGEIVSTGSVRIDGRLEGGIRADGDILIGEEAFVKANIIGTNISIAGEIRGNIEAKGRLEIISTGRVYGDVKVAALLIDDGAIFKGQCVMTGDDRETLLLTKPGEEADSSGEAE